MLGLDYNEQVTNELLNIPLSFHHIDENHPFYRMPLHWHHSYEIVRVISGSLTVYMDDESIITSSDEIVFINQEIIHGYEPSNCTYEVIDFDSNALQLRTALCKDILHTFAANKIQILQFHPVKNADLCDITNRLFMLAALKSADRDLLLLSTLFELLGTIYMQHHYTTNFNISKNAMRFKPLLDYIEKSFMNQITLTDMAKISNLSPNRFGSSFHDYFGQTPLEFLNIYRIEQACMYLINTKNSITDIAYQCGFYDASYFVKVFKKHKNITPRKYRNTFANDNK